MLEVKIAPILLLVFLDSVHGILPDYGSRDDGSPFDGGISGPENSPVFDYVNPGAARIPKSPQEGLTIDELTKKLQSKVNAVSQERAAGGVPAKSIKELEDIMAHPTWLTDTSNMKSDQLVTKNRRIIVVPAPGENWHQRASNEDQREHIKEVINKFHDLKPKGPITDNRITKFVFTHDADLATSRTVQQHNKEVEAAFMEFNRKLDETLSGKNKKAENDKMERDMLDRSFNRVVNFLDRNIMKLKEDVTHKQVCRKHKSHSVESTQEKDTQEAAGYKKMRNTQRSDSGVVDLNPSGMLRFNQMVQTRDGLENALLGLDRPRGGPYKRHALRLGRGNRAGAHPKKHQ